MTNNGGSESRTGRGRWAGWIVLWERTAELVRGLGGEFEGPNIKPPATEAEIAGVEAALGRPLPPSFKRVLLGFSREVDFDWDLPVELEGRFDILEGGALWSLDAMAELDEDRQGLADDWHSDEQYEGSRRWQTTLGWCGGVDRDFLAFDVRVAGEPPVVFLDPEGCLDDDEAWLARDFEDFFDRWSRIGCAGGVRLIDTFVPARGQGIDPECEYAVAFRNALGLYL